jgi:hypothetical protein
MNLGAIMFTDNLEKEQYKLVRKIAESKGVPCHVYSGQWRGFGEKLVMGQKAARELTQYTHLMLIDAFDVIVMATVDEIMSRYLEFGHPFVCQAENNCWPDKEKASRYPECNTPWRYLNSGLYIAEREYLGQLWEKHGPIDPCVYDQGWVTDVFLNDPGCIKLDTNCVLFQSLLASIKNLELINGKLHNTLTDTYPLIAHHHGGQDIRDDYAMKLWN